MRLKRGLILFSALVVLCCLLAGCAPGSQRFQEGPAGFWAGLWHGFICVVTFIIGLFNDSVHMYETNNSGSLYDLGFLIGAMFIFGGSCSGRSRKRRARKMKEKEWEEIAAKAEDRVRMGIRRWLDESDTSDKEWEDIGRKIEERIKRELKDWAED